MAKVNNKVLLWSGVAIAPLFIGASLLQALTRPGFDLTKHEVSLLLNGDLGWIQVIVFVLTGLLGLTFAVGARRALHPGKAGTWGPILLAVYGALLIVAGLVHPDSHHGFPVGAPSGMPGTPSVEGGIHSMAFSLLAIAIIAACFVLARRFAVDKQPKAALYSRLSGAAIIVLIVLGSALMMNGLAGLPLLGVAMVISGWISTTALYLLKRT